jgi:hypothetical protein
MTSNYFDRQTVIDNLSVQDSPASDEVTVMQLDSNTGTLGPLTVFPPPVPGDMIRTTANQFSFELLRPFMIFTGRGNIQYESDPLNSPEFDIKQFAYAAVPVGHPFDDDCQLLNDFEFLLKTGGLWMITVYGSGNASTSGPSLAFEGPTMGLFRYQSGSNTYELEYPYSEMSWAGRANTGKSISYSYTVKMPVYVQPGNTERFKIRNVVAGIPGGSDVVSEALSINVYCYKLYEAH